MKSSIFRLCSYFYSATLYFIGFYGLDDEIRATFKHYKIRYYPKEDPKDDRIVTTYSKFE